jgi:hypothetical protein
MRRADQRRTGSRRCGSRAGPRPRTNGWGSRNRPRARLVQPMPGVPLLLYDVQLVRKVEQNRPRVEAVPAEQRLDRPRCEGTAGRGRARRVHRHGVDGRRTGGARLRSRTSGAGPRTITWGRTDKVTRPATGSPQRRATTAPKGNDAPAGSPTPRAGSGSTMTATASPSCGGCRRSGTAARISSRTSRRRACRSPGSCRSRSRTRRSGRATRTGSAICNGRQPRHAQHPRQHGGEHPPAHGHQGRRRSNRRRFEYGDGRGHPRARARARSAS